jgi:hypothetical protein
VTAEEEARRKRDWSWSPPKRDYQPTGFLRIVLLGEETTSVRHTWSEGKRKKKFEESLGEVVAGIEPLVLAIRKAKEEQRRWHEQRAAERGTASRAASSVRHSSRFHQREDTSPSLLWSMENED